VGGVVESGKSTGVIIVAVGGCSSWRLLSGSQKEIFATCFAMAW